MGGQARRRKEGAVGNLKQGPNLKGVGNNVTIANLFEAQDLRLDDWADVTSSLKSFHAQLVHDPKHRRALLQEEGNVGDADYGCHRSSRASAE